MTGKTALWAGFAAGFLLFIGGLAAFLKTLKLYIFGEKAEGFIVGYASEMRSRYNITNTYRVEYLYQGEKRTATALETKNTFDFSILGKKIVLPPPESRVTVRFDPKKPEAVSISQLAFRGMLVYLLAMAIGGAVMAGELMYTDILRF